MNLRMYSTKKRNETLFHFIILIAMENPNLSQIKRVKILLIKSF